MYERLMEHASASWEYLSGLPGFVWLLAAPAWWVAKKTWVASRPDDRTRLYRQIKRSIRPDHAVCETLYESGGSRVRLTCGHYKIEYSPYEVKADYSWQSPQQLGTLISIKRGGGEDIKHVLHEGHRNQVMNLALRLVENVKRRQKDKDDRLNRIQLEETARRTV